MSGPDYKLFDFRDIAALDDTATSFRSWVSQSSSFFSDFWSQVSSFAAPLMLGPISTEPYDTALASLSKDNLCCVIEFEGRFRALCYASADELRPVVMELLGTTSTPAAESNASDETTETTEATGPSGPVNTPLSLVELSLVQLYIDQLVSAMSEGWMGPDTVAINASELSKDPRKKRLFRSKDLVTKTSIQIDLKAGKTVLHWLLPKQRMCDLLDSTVDRRSAREQVRLSPQKVGQLPIEVISVLGSATLSMAKLSNVSVGELIVLDQRIDEPLTASVNHSPFYQCWPGKVGKQQALEITSCLHTCNDEPRGNQ
ncbi:MAG: hypothetical protein HKN47_00700 [Pirellulaceae bacterium]|nr:hypothetical protein [Pirellulaceae bacterium]